jgi:hypothetical protein
MLMSSQKSGQNQDIRIANELFENVAKFKYVVTAVTNQSDIHDEMKKRLNSRNAYYHSFPDLLPSHIISSKLRIKTYRTIIFSVVLDGCVTWSLTLKEEHRLRVFETRVLRRIFGLKREEDGSWRK